MSRPTLFLFLLMGRTAPGDVWRASAQDRALSVDQVTRMLTSGPEDDFDMPEFVAAAYGPRAKPGLELILEHPSERANFLIQLAALTAAQYPRIGIRQDLLLDYATGPRLRSLPAELREILRTRAMKALSTQPNASLRDFWAHLQAHPTALYRQFVPFGLACSVGTAALPDLEAMSHGVDSVLLRQASRALREFAERGAEARVCGRASRGDAPEFPREIRPGLMARGEHFLREIP
jgi:hypothetical protein